MRSWLYLTRLNLSDSSVEKVEAQIGDNFSHLMDDSEPTTIKDIADEIEKVVAEYNRQESI
jgi:hypothetical protein